MSNRTNNLDISYFAKISVLVGLFSTTIAGMLFVDPIPQDPTFHLFADMRSCLNIPNFGDVSSNIGFLVVGLFGLWRLLGPGKITFERREDARPFLIFFAAVAMVSVGSAYYHAAPDNDRLFWDRLPMTVAFMALFAGILADRVHRGMSLRVLLPVLIALGVLSLMYWSWTEAEGRGDLRPYGLVQFFPMLALPVICFLFRNAPNTGGLHLVWVIFWYAVAKLLETFDVEIFLMLGGQVSGHTLKHLAAAVACYFVLRMIVANRTDAAAAG